MPLQYTPGSFTKNFSWNRSYKRLHSAVLAGFDKKMQPVEREQWRAQSKIADSNRQLIPLNFFLFSLKGEREDFVLADTLVGAAIDGPYSANFAQLSLFAFHLSNSGKWRGSQWQDGRVAGWANDLVREAWHNDRWSESALSENGIESFLADHLAAEPKTHRKVLTNYRYMLESAGVTVDGNLQEAKFAQRWYVDAVMLFWDRQLFSGELPTSPTLRALEDIFIAHEIFKLLGCSEAQGRTFVRAAATEYLDDVVGKRADQIQKLRDSGAIAA